MTSGGSLGGHPQTPGADLDRGWLTAGLCLGRLLPVDTRTLPRAVAWLHAALTERVELPPAGVVLDIGALLTRDRPGSARRGDLGDRVLSDAVRRYDDAVLARLDRDPRTVEASFAIARLPPDLQARGIGIFATAVLDRIGFAAGVGLKPRVLRDVGALAPRVVVEEGLAALRDSASARASLASGYEALVRGARGVDRLVSDADVFTLENIVALADLGQRVAIAQAVDAREAIERGLPRRIRSARRGHGSSVAAVVDDESAFPAGGFSSLSTSGTIENVVASELIYMDPRGGEGTASAIDLFDLRFAEGELLYYTRDEAIIARRRRLFSFLLADDLASSRVKDPSLPWQRIVLLLGVLAAVVRRLERDLGHESLAFRVVFVRELAARPSGLQRERALVALLFREWVDKGVMEIVESSQEDEARRLSPAARRSIVQSVLLTARAEAIVSWEAALGTVKPPVPAAISIFRQGLADPGDSGVAPEGPETLEAWTQATIELLEELL